MKPTEVLQESPPDVLTAWRSGLWRFRFCPGSRIIAGLTDRSADPHAWGTQVASRGLVFAEQTHGASVALVDAESPAVNPIPGCDALLSRVPGLGLVIRTADCLPIFFWDPAQQVVGLAHVGWRGLVHHLPMRMVSALAQYCRSRPGDLWVGIGPAIRACCYDVGLEFEDLFGPFLQQRDNRRTFDLVGCATQQLVATGIRPSRLVDCGQCTACDTTRWYSVRKEGEATGRMRSFILIRP